MLDNELPQYFGFLLPHLGFIRFAEMLRHLGQGSSPTVNRRGQIGCKVREFSSLGADGCIIVRAALRQILEPWAIVMPGIILAEGLAKASPPRVPVLSQPVIPADAGVVSQSEKGLVFY